MGQTWPKKKLAENRPKKKLLSIGQPNRVDWTTKVQPTIGGYCAQHSNRLIIFSFAAECELLTFCMQMKPTGKTDQRRREDYLEWRSMFNVVYGGLRWWRRWLGSSVAAVAMLLLFPCEDTSPCVFSFSFFMFSFSSLLSLYSFVFFSFSPLFFFFLFFFSSSPLFFSFSSFFLLLLLSSFFALSSSVFIDKNMGKEAYFLCPVMAQG